MKMKTDFVTNSSSTNWMLITSIIPAAGAVIGWAAANSQSSFVDNDNLPVNGEGEILSGAEAQDWLTQNGMLGSDNRLTERFWQWYDQSWSSESNSELLMGIIGEFDTTKRNEAFSADNIENLAIIVNIPQAVQEIIKDDISNNESTIETSNEEPSVDEESQDEQSAQEQEIAVDKPTAVQQQESGEEDVKLQQEEIPSEEVKNRSADVTYWQDKINDAIKNNIKNPQQIHHIHQIVHLQVTDSSQHYSLEIQNGIVRINQEVPQNENITLSMSQEILNNILNGKYKTPEDFVKLLNPIKIKDFSIEYDADVIMSIKDKEHFTKDFEEVLEALNIQLDATKRTLLHTALQLIT
jgi:putative sterol carrier protein